MSGKSEATEPSLQAAAEAFRKATDSFRKVSAESLRRTTEVFHETSIRDAETAAIIADGFRRPFGGVQPRHSAQPPSDLERIRMVLAAQQQLQLQPTQVPRSPPAETEYRFVLDSFTRAAQTSNPLAGTYHFDLNFGGGASIVSARVGDIQFPRLPLPSVWTCEGGALRLMAGAHTDSRDVDTTKYLDCGGKLPQIQERRVHLEIRAPVASAAEAKTAAVGARVAVLDLDASGTRLVPVRGHDTVAFTDEMTQHYPPQTPAQYLPQNLAHHPQQGLTLVFRGPDLPLCFPPDVMIVEAIASPVLYPRLAFVAPMQGVLQTGDRIVLAGFACGAAEVDAYVNRLAGHAVACASPAMFTLDPSVDISGLVAKPDGHGLLRLGMGAPIVMYVVKNRISIPVTLRVRR